MSDAMEIEIRSISATKGFFMNERKPYNCSFCFQFAVLNGTGKTYKRLRTKVNGKCLTSLQKRYVGFKLISKIPSGYEIMRYKID